MPLVRVTGVDADAFDISDVAKMNDHNNHTRRNTTSWHNTRRVNNNNSKNSSSPTDTDETPSTDSSSMVSSILHSDRDGGSRHSFASVNNSSTHSTTLLLSNSNNGGSGNNNNNNNNNNIRSYNISGSGNNNSNNFAHYNFAHFYDDPRNPFDTQKIPEEDEDNVSSAMDDCSLSGHTNNSYRGVQQQQQPTRGGMVRRTNSQRSHSSTMSSSSNIRHHSSSSSHQLQQRHHQFSSSFREEEEDESTTSSIQTNSMRNKDGAAYTSQLVSQLESQVAKLNFELATTKSSLDQLQLENRKLHDEKIEWHKKARLMQEEYDQLRLKIEQMERDKLMRTMEGTKGVARGRTSMDVGSCVVWGGSSVSGNTWADNNQRGDANTITSYKREMRQNNSQRLEVPFNTFSETEDRHTYTRPRRPSTASTGSYRSYVDDDYKSVGSVGSVNLDFSGRSQDSAEEQKKSLRSSFLGTLLPLQKLQEMSRQIEEKVSLAESTLSNSLTIESAVNDAVNDNNKLLGHIEEEYDDDDPFATWSENRERLSNKKKWFQRGDGQKPQSQNIDAEDEQLTRANNEESVEDPFDTAKCENKESEYTSFAEVGNHSDGGLGEDFGSMPQQPKRGGFRLPWQRGNEGR